MANPFDVAPPPAAQAANPFDAPGPTVARAAVRQRPTIETPKSPRENPLRTAAAFLEAPMELYGAAGMTRSGKPEFGQLWNLLRQGKYEEAQRLYSPFDDEQVKRYAKQNPDDPIAQVFANNGIARGLGTFIGEWGNPAYAATGRILGPVLNVGARALGRGVEAARAVSPAANYAATAAEHLGSQVAKPVNAALERGKEKVADVAGGVLRAAGRATGVAGTGPIAEFFDRYAAAGLPQRGGRRFVNAALAANAAPEHAAATAHAFFDKIGKDLTLAQQREMQRLSYIDENGVPLVSRPVTLNLVRHQTSAGPAEVSATRGGTYYTAGGDPHLGDGPIAWLNRGRLGGPNVVRETATFHNPLHLTPGGALPAKALQALKGDEFLKDLAPALADNEQGWPDPLIGRLRKLGMDAEHELSRAGSNGDTKVLLDSMAAHVAREAGYDAIVGGEDANGAREVFKIANPHPVPARDVNVPEPSKGPSLAERAAEVRKYIIARDAEQAALNIRKQESLYDSGRFFPMRSFNDKPVFRKDALPTDVPADDEQAVVNHLQRRATGRFAASVTGKGLHKKYPTILEPGVEEDLDPEYDPIYQLKQHYGETARAIANERTRLGLEELPSYNPKTGNQRTVPDLFAQAEGGERLPGNVGGFRVDGSAEGGATKPAFARMEAQHYIDRPTGRLLFGEGAAGEKAVNRYASRVAKARSADAVRDNPEMQAFAADRGVLPRQLGTRAVVNRSALPTMTRMFEIARTQKGVNRLASQLARTKAPLGNFAKATSMLRRAGGRLGEESKALQGVAAENRRLLKSAREAAPDLRKSVDDIDDAVRKLQDAPAVASSPTKSAILEEARLMRAEAIEQSGVTDIDTLLRENVIPRVRKKKATSGVEIPDPAAEAAAKRAKRTEFAVIKPSFVWVNGKWQKADEFADVPDKYLDLSDRPKAPPAEAPERGGVPRSKSNVDDVATQVGMSSGDELIEALSNRKPKPGIAEFMDLAERRVRQGLQSQVPEEARATLEAMHMGNKTVPEALEQLRSDAEEMRPYVTQFENEIRERGFAQKTFGAPVAKMGAVADTTGRRIAQAVENIDKGQEQVAATTQKGATKASGLGDKLDDRKAALAEEADKIKARAEVAREFDKRMRNMYQQIYGEIRDKLKAESPHAPAGYTLESSIPGLESPSRSGKAIDDSFAKFFLGQQKISLQETEDAKKFWNSMQVLNRMARMGVVLFPNVHGINNEGMHYLAEGGDPVTMAKILSKQYKADPKMAARAYASGAATNRSQALFDFDGGFHSTLPSGERSQIIANKTGPFATAVRPIVQGALKAEKGYNALNAWLFHDVEQGYAIDLFSRKVAQGMEDGDAAMAVRNALGRVDNLSPQELRNQLNRIFYFYPWMKTVIPFWVKKGVIDPKWWAAPVQGIRTNNQQQGYDDPARPFTGTFGHRDDGSYRRITAPVPQRVLENVAEAARLPVDLATGDFAGAGADAKFPLNYVAGHLNPALSVGYDAALAVNAMAGHHRPAPFNTFDVDPKQTKAQQAQAIAGKLLGHAIAPFSRVDSIRQDPAAALAAYATGAFEYGTPSPRQVAADKKAANIVAAPFHASIAELNTALKAAQANGDDAAVARIQGNLARVTALRDAAVARAMANRLAARQHGSAPSLAPLQPRAGASSSNPFDAVSP